MATARGEPGAEMRNCQFVDVVPPGPPVTVSPSQFAVPLIGQSTQDGCPGWLGNQSPALSSAYMFALSISCLILLKHLVP